MPYNLKNLNVSSLDFDDIKRSLINFFEQQNDLKNLDFKNQSSAVNLLLNILSTATAYNGVYAQYGYINSFATTATVLESLMGIAANSSVLLVPTSSANATATITATTSLQEYSTFNGKATNGADLFFFNLDGVSAGQSKSIKLYCGTQVTDYVSYNYETQSMVLPYTVNPETISFYETDINTGTVTKWTRVDKSNTTTTSNNTHFTVINGSQGYIVTNNFSTAKTITTTSTVTVTAVTSNGAIGNESIITPRTDSLIASISSFGGGYDLISINRAKSSLLFKATGQERCVTLRDYKNAIMSSGIKGTDIESEIIVSNGSYPGQVKIYVNGLTSDSINALMSYLSPLIPLGINIIYEQ